MPEIGNTSVFSQTDASNGTGTMPSWLGSAAPSTLDDAGRALQGAVTREWNWRNVTLTTAGTTTAYTLTYSVAPAAYYNGQEFACIINATNTGAATLNVNALGAKSIRRIIGGTATALASGDLVAGMYVKLSYNTVGDYFVWTNALPQALETTSNPQFATIELGAASDTTISRSAAGVIAIEGGNVPKENRANTFSALQTISSGGLAVSGGDNLVTGSGGLGYGTGSGGTVTQLTSKSTGVTLNKINGQITMNAAALVAGSSVIFAVSNTTVTTTNVVIITPDANVVNADNYRFEIVSVIANQFKVRLTNLTGGTLSEPVVFNFAVIKAVNA